MNSQPPGEQLRKLHIRVGITTRDVESGSQKIAEEEKNQEFQISNAWLTSPVSSPLFVDRQRDNALKNQNFLNPCWRFVRQLTPRLEQ
jgi:hypothetical protein